MQHRYLIIVIFLVMPISAFTAANADVLNKYYHYQSTSFIVDSDHKQLFCLDCHINDNFQTITASCEQCHAMMTERELVSEHDNFLDECVTCHDNLKARGQPPGHEKTGDLCDDCHLPSAWK